MEDGTTRPGARVWRPGKASNGTATTEGHAAGSAGVTLGEAAEGLREWWKRGSKQLREGELRPGLGGLLRDVAQAALEKASEHVDADRMLQHAMRGLIELAASRYALDPGAQWKPGEPLKVLLAGYSGTRNTGADVRVEEMIRQFRHIFGDENVDLSILTIDPELTRGYFRTVKQIHLPKVFPRFLFDTVHEQHAVIACEGSMFKSKFANALATMMVGALGLASAEGKIAVGYGGEAGNMDESLKDLVRDYCQDTLIIARNDASRAVLAELGVASRSGTDTAWTFEPAPLEVGRRVLMEKGWDGVTPILALCPINPFWWPVKPNVPRAVLHAFGGMYEDAHFGSVYFHNDEPEVAEKQERYLEAIAKAVERFRTKHDVFPVMMGSEQLDRQACEELGALLGSRTPVIVSDEHDMYEMVSIMRNATYMVSSRYHAIVTTMAGGVVSAGITMDERIRNLMADRGMPELALEVDDPDLAEKTFAVLESLVRDADAIRASIDDCVTKNLERMGRMGMELVDHVRTRHPELPFRPELGSHGDPWDHLPSLPPAVEALVARSRARSARSVSESASRSASVSESASESRSQSRSRSRSEGGRA